MLELYSRLGYCVNTSCGPTFMLGGMGGNGITHGFCSKNVGYHLGKKFQEKNPKYAGGV